MRVNFASLMFVAALAAVSGLSLLRVVIAAIGLPKSDFAEYATVVALGSFLSSVISFGSVEVTIKTFPRLAENGKIGQMRRESRRLMRVIALRSILFAAPFLTAGLLLSFQPLLWLGMGMLYASGVGCFGILASVQRALGQPLILLAGTAFRALIAFGTVALLVMCARVELWVLIGLECTAMILASIVSEAFIFRTVTAYEPDVPTKSELDKAATVDGLRIFAAFTLTSAPFYLDRFYVSSVFGPDEAAQYAVLAVFLMAASLIVNTICQRVGPDVVKMALNDGGERESMNHLLMWSGTAVAIWSLFLGCTALLFQFELVPSGLLKYQITPSYLIPIFFLGAVSIASLFEFLMMALDREEIWLRFVFFYFFLILAVAAAAAFWTMSLISFIWLLAGARAVYALLLASRGNFFTRRKVSV
jgi:O-antigen/teichoic acid export membrane protein